MHFIFVSARFNHCQHYRDAFCSSVVSPQRRVQCTSFLFLRVSTIANTTAMHFAAPLSHLSVVYNALHFCFCAFQPLPTLPRCILQLRCLTSASCTMHFIFVSARFNHCQHYRDAFCSSV